MADIESEGYESLQERWSDLLKPDGNRKSTNRQFVKSEIGNREKKESAKWKNRKARSENPDVIRGSMA